MTVVWTSKESQRLIQILQLVRREKDFPLPILEEFAIRTFQIVRQLADDWPDGPDTAWKDLNALAQRCAVDRTIHTYYLEGWRRPHDAPQLSKSQCTCVATVLFAYASRYDYSDPVPRGRALHLINGGHYALDLSARDEPVAGELADLGRALVMRFLAHE
jgi:hypothetical protein